MPDIEVKNAGPIQFLKFTAVPGVTLLYGANDEGKSCTLRGLSRVLGGDDQVSCRDGEIDGYVQIGAARIILGRSTRRSGELEVYSLEGSMPVDVLADPRIKDPVAADARRIKALVTISGVKADAALFYDLVGGKEAFDTLIPPDTLHTDDLVDLAGKIERALQRLALAKEKEAQTEEGKAIADRGAGDGLDLNAETDPKKLQKALEDAAGHKSKLDEQVRTARKAKSDAEEARKELAEVGQSSESSEAVGRAMETAQSKWRDASMEASDLKGKVERLKNELSVAQAEYGSILAKKESAQDAIVAVESRAKAIEARKAMSAAWEKAIDAAANVVEPRPTEIEQAESAVQRAREAGDLAANVRLAKERLEKAKQHQARADAIRVLCHRLREAARGTDDVLSAAVASDYLAVEAGRLVTVKADGKKVLLSDRSMGTRWKIALQEAAARLRRMGIEKEAVIVAPQEAWESLDVGNRRKIHGVCIELEICMLAAEAIGEEVRFVAYDPAADWKARAGEELAAK